MSKVDMPEVSLVDDICQKNTKRQKVGDVWPSIVTFLSVMTSVRRRQRTTSVLKYLAYDCDIAFCYDICQETPKDDICQKNSPSQKAVCEMLETEIACFLLCHLSEYVKLPEVSLVDDICQKIHGTEIPFV